MENWHIYLDFRDEMITLLLLQHYCIDDIAIQSMFGSGTNKQETHFKSGFISNNSHDPRHLFDFAAGRC